MSKHLGRWFVGACCAVVLAPAAHAQDVPKTVPDPAHPAAGAIVDPHAAATYGVLTPQMNDQRIARWVSVDNKSMVECAKMAESKSTNEHVRNFAKMIVADHEKAQQALDSVAAVKPEKAEDQAQRPSTAVLVRDDGQSRAGGLMFRPTDFVAVKEQICESMREEAKKHFEAVSGPEFDRAFFVHMMFGHQAMLATIDAVDDMATDALQPHLKALRDVSQHHLEQLRELEKQIQAPATAARPGDAEKK